MIYEWVSAGAIFGIEAFFAVFTFLMLCAAILGLLTVLIQIFRVEDKG